MVASCFSAVEQRLCQEKIGADTSLADKEAGVHAGDDLQD